MSRNQEFRFVAQYFDADAELVAEEDIVVNCNDWETAIDTAEMQAQAKLDEYSADFYSVA